MCFSLVFSFPAENKEEGITSGTVKPGFDSSDDKINVEIPKHFFPFYGSYYGPVFYGGELFPYHTVYGNYGGHVNPYYGESHVLTTNFLSEKSQIRASQYQQLSIFSSTHPIRLYFEGCGQVVVNFFFLRF